MVKLSYPQVSGSTWALNILEAKKTRLVLLVFAGMLGISVLDF